MRRTVIAVAAVIAVTSCSGQSGHADKLAHAACHDIIQGDPGAYGQDVVKIDRGVAEADRASSLDDHWLRLASAIHTLVDEPNNAAAYSAMGDICNRVLAE